MELVRRPKTHKMDGAGNIFIAKTDTFPNYSLSRNFSTQNFSMPLHVGGPSVFIGYLYLLILYKLDEVHKLTCTRLPALR
jgi:hypothetical protein